VNVLLRLIRTIWDRTSIKAEGIARKVQQTSIICHPFPSLPSSTTTLAIWNPAAVLAKAPERDALDTVSCGTKGFAEPARAIVLGSSVEGSESPGFKVPCKMVGVMRAEGMSRFKN
jgi:hypothetical protein